MDVAVVVQGAPAAPRLREALLATCSEALKDRSCVAQDSGAPPVDAPALAVITWPDGDLRHVRVSVERGTATGEARLVHDSRFADEDPLVERWRSIALVISALVSNTDPALADAAISPRGTRDRDNDWQPDDSGRGWLELVGLLGPGLSDGSVRAGAALGAARTIGSLPAFLSVSASYALRPLDERGLSVRWLTVGAGAGLGWALPAADVALRARSEIVIQQIRAMMPAPTYTALHGGQRWSPGLRAQVEVVWPARSVVSLAAGLQLWALPGGTGIRLDGRPLGSSGWLGYAGVVGAQYALP